MFFNLHIFIEKGGDKERRREREREWEKKMKRK